jgi:signal peptidase I
MFGIIKNCVFKLIYFLVIIYLLIFIPTIFGEKPLVVISGSMEPTLNVGGILYYHEKDFEDFKVDDVIVYQLEDHIISHRVYDITENGIITKGDANNSYDNLLINENQILGEGTNWCIPLIGYYADFIYNHKYLLFITLLIIVVDMISDKHKMKEVYVNEKNE